MTEAFAHLQGVLFALEMQISRVIFESDALSVIQALTTGDLGGEVGHILHDIKSSSHFSCYSFKHLKRDGNIAAHALAREAKLSGQTQIWKGVTPLPSSRFLGMTCCYFSCCFLPVSLLCCNSISSWNDTLPSLPLKKKKKSLSWANKREYRYLLLHWTPWLRNNNNGLLNKKIKKFTESETN